MASPSASSLPESNRPPTLREFFAARGLKLISIHGLGDIDPDKMRYTGHFVERDGKIIRLDDPSVPAKFKEISVEATCQAN